jgi:MFS-type transporter involved in bile tolerance (Atg22 family)
MKRTALSRHFDTGAGAALGAAYAGGAALALSPAGVGGVAMTAAVGSAAGAYLYPRVTDRLRSKGMGGMGPRNLNQDQFGG